MYRRTRVRSYLYGKCIVLGIVSPVKMVQVIWQEVDRLNANAMTFCTKNLKIHRLCNSQGVLKPSPWKPKDNGVIQYAASSS